MQSRVVCWRRLFVSSIFGTRAARRRTTNRFAQSRTPETLEVRQLLSATAFDLDGTVQQEELSVDQIALAEHVQSLRTAEFRNLTAEQTPFLTRQQIEGLRNRSAFQRIPLNARQALTTEQVTWLRVRRTGLRVRRTGLQGLTSDQVDALTVEQVQSLKPRDLRKLSPSQIPNLSGSQTARLSSYHQLRKLSEEAREALTGDQIRMLNVRRSRLDLLSEEQISELSLAQLERVRRESDVEMLTDEQLDIRNMMAAGQVPPDRPASISAVKTVAEMRVGDKTVGEIRSLTYRHIESLTFEHATCVTLEQVASLLNR